MAGASRTAACLATSSRPPALLRRRGPAPASAAAELPGAARGGGHRLVDGGAESVRLEPLEAGDRGAARRRDLVLERRRVPAGFLREPGGAEDGLRGEGARGLAREPHAHTRVGERL